MLKRACLFLLLFPLLARADDECYRNFLVVDQTVLWDLSEPQKLDLQLSSWHRFQGSVKTPAYGHFDWDGESNLNAGFDYNTPLLALPYNVYRMDVEIGESSDPGRIEDSRDFTRDCTDPGLSFYPGAQVHLAPTVLARDPAGEPPGPTPVHIRIWGVLR
jgi:hypothetical protein